MKLLIVNSNMTQFVTDTVAAHAGRVAAQDTEIKAVTGTFGAPVIGCRTEDAIGAHSTLDLVSRHAKDCDAVLVAVSFDSGVRAAREMLPIPVVGMTEAALVTASMLGGKFAVLTFGKRANPLYEELIQAYGLSDRSVGVSSIEVPPGFDVKDIDSTQDMLIEEIKRLVNEEGAESVYLAGAVFAGMGERMQSQVPVPLIDGISCGVKQAELLASLNLPKPTSGSYQLPSRKELGGVSDSLRDYYKNLPKI